MRRFHLSVLILGITMLTACSSKTPPSCTTDLFAMDTYMNLKIYSDDGNDILKQAEQRIVEIENLLSVTKEESDISRINHANGNTVEVSKDTEIILNKALDLYQESNGALDISIYPVLSAWGFTNQNYRIPTENELQLLLSHVGAEKVSINENIVQIPDEYQIDTGALTKGYTSDCLIELFKKSGVESAIVNLGGNVQTLGTKPDGTLWSVAITNPFSPSDHLGILQIENQAVITSGNYERYFIGEDGNKYWHILDSKTGKPANNGLVSVTVIGESGLECDALSTALFIEGTEQAIQHWKKSENFEMICVTSNHTVLITEGIADAFQNTSDLKSEVIYYE